MRILEYVIDYKKHAEKFFRKHEDIRQEYEADLKIFLADQSSARVDVKTIKGKKSDIIECVLAAGVLYL